LANCYYIVSYSSDLFDLLERYAWDLNALGSGEEVAISLGVNVNRLRLVTLMLATLMASSTIAFTGIIGSSG